MGNPARKLHFIGTVEVIIGLTVEGVGDGLQRNGKIGHPVEWIEARENQFSRNLLYDRRELSANEFQRIWSTRVRNQRQRESRVYVPRNHLGKSVDLLKISQRVVSDSSGERIAYDHQFREINLAPRLRRQYDGRGTHSQANDRSATQNS